MNEMATQASNGGDFGFAKLNRVLSRMREAKNLNKKKINKTTIKKGNWCLRAETVCFYAGHPCHIRGSVLYRLVWTGPGCGPFKHIWIRRGFKPKINL